MLEIESQQCQLCGVIVEHTHKHHLVPQQKSKGMPRDLKHATIECCRPCSKQVHALFSNSEMKRYYNTFERLKEDPRVQKWILWRMKHPSVMDIQYSGKS